MRMLRGRGPAVGPVAVRVGSLVSVLVAVLVSSRANAQAAAPLASFDSAWSAISKTYWDTAFISNTWRRAHDSLRLDLGAAPAQADERRAIRALIAVPRQSHFVLIPADAVPTAAGTQAGDTAGGASDGPRGTAGLDLRTLDDRVVVFHVDPDGAASRAGVRAGDVVRAVGGMELDEARELLRVSLPPGSEPPERLMVPLALGALAGAVGDEIELVLVRRYWFDRRARIVLQESTDRTTQVGNLPPMAVSATRDSLALRDGSGWVAHLRFSSWFPALSADIDSMLFASRSAAGIIFDLRGNPGGIIGMLSGVSGHVLDTAVSLGTLHGRGMTLRFAANPRRVDMNGRSFPPFKGPVVVLTDELTGSTSEFFAAGLQSTGRAKVFGQRSAGQSLPALMRRLPSGDVLLHAIADHVDAMGRRIEGVGVVPDEVIPFTRADLRAGRDPVLDRARSWIAGHAPR